MIMQNDLNPSMESPVETVNPRHVVLLLFQRVDQLTGRNRSTRFLQERDKFLDLDLCER